MHFLSHQGSIFIIKLTITNFKHNTDKRPFDIFIQREDSLPVCPVQVMVEYCKLRDNRAGPLFCHTVRIPITVGQFNADLRRCLLFCRFDTTRYKGHSFHIGAACHTAEKGFSNAQIRVLGHWKYDAFKLYIKSDTVRKLKILVGGEFCLPRIVVVVVVV